MQATQLSQQGHAIPSQAVQVAAAPPVRPAPGTPWVLYMHVCGLRADADTSCWAGKREGRDGSRDLYHHTRGPDQGRWTRPLQAAHLSQQGHAMAATRSPFIHACESMVPPHHARTPPEGFPLLTPRVIWHKSHMWSADWLCNVTYKPADGRAAAANTAAQVVR